MEKIIKEFKNLSYFIGAMGVLDLVTLFGDLQKVQNMDIATLSTMANVDVSSMGIPAGTTLTIAKVFAIIPMVLSVLALFFLAYKGVKEAKDPSNAKFHLVLAVICAIFFVISSINSVVAVFAPNADVFLNVMEAIISAASCVLMVYYFNYGKKIRTAE